MDEPRRRGLLGLLLYGELGELLLDGDLAVSDELEAQFAAERRAEGRAHPEDGADEPERD